MAHCQCSVNSKCLVIEVAFFPLNIVPYRVPPVICAIDAGAYLLFVHYGMKNISSPLQSCQDFQMFQLNEDAVLKYCWR